MSSVYSVEVRDQFGNLVSVITRPMKKQFSVYRNKSGSCQFTMDLFDAQATSDILALNQYDIVFRRQGTPVFAGQISYVHPTVDGDKKEVDIIATGYFDLLDQRFVTSDYPGYDALHNRLPFVSTDSGQIAWDLITYTQFPLSEDGSYKMQGSTPTIAQSFIAQGTANVTTIKMLLQNDSATGNLIVELYNDNGAPTTPIANSLVTIPVSSLPTSLGWYEIDYSGVLPEVVEGGIYWIRAWLDTTQSGTNGVEWFYLGTSASTDYYPNGRAYSPENASLFQTYQDLQFFILLDDNTYQMAKNTYLGFLKGTINTSFNVTPVYDRFKKIKTAIEDLSNAYNGPDFNISVSIDANNRMTKYFNIFYPRQGINNTSLNFTYPGNIKKIDKPKDGKTMVNDLAMRGQGYGTAELVEEVFDATSMYTYAQRQDVEQQSDMSDAGTLTSEGQEVIRIRKDPLDLPALTLDGRQPPYLGSYGIGDTILVNIVGIPLLDLIDLYRIEQIDVTIDDDDVEEVTLTLSLA